MTVVVVRSRHVGLDRVSGEDEGITLPTRAGMYPREDLSKRAWNSRVADEEYFAQGEASRDFRLRCFLRRHKAAHHKSCTCSSHRPGGICNKYRDARERRRVMRKDVRIQVGQPDGPAFLGRTGSSQQRDLISDDDVLDLRDDDLSCTPCLEEVQEDDGSSSDEDWVFV